MNRISSGQLTCILLLSESFMLMCMTLQTGLSAMYGTAIAFILRLLLCVPVLLLYRKGFSLSSYCSEKHYILPCIFALYFIARGGLSFVFVWNCSEQLSLPFNGSLTTAVLIGAVCLYTSSLGLRAFSRAASVTAGFLAAALVILIIGAWQRADLDSISLADNGSIISGTLRSLSLADSLPLFLVLLSFTEKGRPLKKLLFLPLSLILWELVLFLCIAVLGSSAASGEYPFFLLTSVSQPLASQRADAVYLIIFVLLCTIRLTMFTVLSAHIMGMLFPKLKFRSIIALLLMIGAGAAFGAIGFSGGVLCILPITFLTLTVPVWLIIRSRKETQKHEA